MVHRFVQAYLTWQQVSTLYPFSLQILLAISLNRGKQLWGNWAFAIIHPKKEGGVQMQPHVFKKKMTSLGCKFMI